MTRSAWMAAFVFFLLFPTVSFADSVNLGFISFDVLIPSGTSPGVNVFNLLNLTGDPGLGGFALPPDFPAMDSLTFLNSELTLNPGSGAVVVLLGNLGPGGLDPAGPIEFSSTLVISSAIFTATLSRTSFRLADGSTFLASSAINVALAPTSGNRLQAGTDFALITASSPPTTVTEPESLSLLGTGLIGMAVAVRIRKKLSERVEMGL